MLPCLYIAVHTCVIICAENGGAISEYFCLLQERIVNPLPTKVGSVVPGSRTTTYRSCRDDGRVYLALTVDPYKDKGPHQKVVRTLNILRRTRAQSAGLYSAGFRPATCYVRLVKNHEQSGPNPGPTWLDRCSCVRPSSSYRQSSTERSKAPFLPCLKSGVSRRETE